MQEVPPPTRGWPPVAACRAGIGRGSPAHAGMARSSDCCRPMVGGFPRPRGDGPHRTCRNHRPRWVPPPTRGWPLRIHPMHILTDGSPAHAGMAPTDGLISQPASPRSRGVPPPTILALLAQAGEVMPRLRAREENEWDAPAEAITAVKPSRHRRGHIHRQAAIISDRRPLFLHGVVDAARFTGVQPAAAGSFAYSAWWRAISCAMADRGHDHFVVNGVHSAARVSALADGCEEEVTGRANEHASTAGCRPWCVQPGRCATCRCGRLAKDGSLHRFASQATEPQCTD